MATLKKLKEDTLNITSKILKKDEDFLPISPEFIKDLKNKTLLENSALKLSISDYELMCRNDKVLNMMAIALNKPKAKLKKFCKHMTVFKENISKSPKSIANKINGINGPITNLPIGVRSIILEKFAEILPTKYVLRDWIDIDKLNWEYLAFNPNAIDFLEENYDNIEWFELAENPNAIDLLKKNPTKINWYRLSLNPNAIKLLEKNPDEIVWDHLSGNPNAIHLLKKRLELEELYGDDFANTNRINWYSLSSNPNAIDLLKAQIKYEESLQHKLKGWDLKIKWEYLCLNPKAIKLLENNPNKINWNNLSVNPNAIKLLKKNQNMINWEYLSANPNAIDLIKERIEYERTLTQKQYNDLQSKIDWKYLSKNPSIFTTV